MLTKIQNWGNSLALRIPKAFAHATQLKVNSLVEISHLNGQIIITPVIASNWTLDKLLADINKKNIPHITDTGHAIGKEVW